MHNTPFCQTKGYIYISHRTRAGLPACRSTNSRCLDPSKDYKLKVLGSYWYEGGILTSAQGECDT